LPAVYQVRAFARDGGLLSYGPDAVDIFRRSALYVDRILRGAKPANLPVQLPIKFEMTLNLKTAKSLGLTIPPSLQLRADEVIRIGMLFAAMHESVHGTKPRCAALQQVVGYWKRCGPSAPLGQTAALTQKGYSCEPADGRPSKLKIGVILCCSEQPGDALCPVFRYFLVRYR
jgi:ABC transporter substrate binding protein